MVKFTRNATILALGITQVLLTLIISKSIRQTRIRVQAMSNKWQQYVIVTAMHKNAYWKLQKRFTQTQNATLLGCKVVVFSNVHHYRMHLGVSFDTAVAAPRRRLDMWLGRTLKTFQHRSTWAWLHFLSLLSMRQRTIGLRYVTRVSESESRAGHWSVSAEC